jgi:hypothetical protein
LQASINIQQTSLATPLLNGVQSSIVEVSEIMVKRQKIPNRYGEKAQSLQLDVVAFPVERYGA